MPGYIPNTEAQQLKMLRDIGMSHFEQLFADIPESVRLKKRLNLPQALSEPELLAKMRALAAKNATVDDYACFLGAGAYDHIVPSAVRSLLSRQEFYTAYTPYQPEISQGTLTAIFEFQTMICELTGMDAANASMYDGATAIAEAAKIACAATGRAKIVVAGTVNPQDRAVVATYARFKKIAVEYVGFENGTVSMELLDKMADVNTAAVILQSPNFFGAVEDIAAAARIAHKNGAKLIVSCNPVSLALLESPGALGADIAVGEGQSLGSPLSFGGPYIGFFAVKKELMRRMPGRIVGKTTDKNGKTGYVLTLQAREQHIRREKASSNICSNEALNALAATITLSLLGKSGLREMALLCARKARYLHDKLIETGLFKPAFSAPFFNEFTLVYSGDAAALGENLQKHRILGGLDASAFYPELSGAVIIAVTEKRTRAEMDRFVEGAVELR